MKSLPPGFLLSSILSLALSKNLSSTVHFQRKIFILYRNKILNVSVPPGYLNGTNTKFYQLAWPSRPHLALSAALGLNSTILVILFHKFINFHSILCTLIQLTYLYGVWLCSVTILLWNSTFCFFSCFCCCSLGFCDNSVANLFQVHSAFGPPFC